jgi:pre-mRNA-splicing factor CWC22
MSRFFAHLLYTDALPWTVFSVVRMTEDDTTSSSRIFLKILLQELSESLGMKELVQRFMDEYMQEHFTSMFPKDSPKNTRFAINYYTSVGLGPLT